MKYGLLYMKDTKNLGDDIQSFAQSRFLPKIDYLIDREDIGNFKSKHGEKVAVIMNAWWMWKKWNWPPSNDIVPLPVSMHFTMWNPTNWGSAITDEILDGLGGEYLKAYGPVGCRDNHTLKIMRSKKIDAYFSGCMTLTLPKMPKKNNKEKYICLVDVDSEISEKVKKDVKGGVVIKSFTHDLLLSNKDLSWKEREKQVKDRLTIYQNAQCIITSRLHCALPCMALEVPVCIVRREMHYDRFSPYLDFVYNYTIDDFLSGKYDINNPPKNKDDYKQIRNDLISRCESFIKNVSDNSNKNLTKVRYSDNDVKEWQYDLMKDALEKWFLISRDMLREYNKTIDYLRKIEKENSDLKNSTSWRITKPIRKGKEVVEKIVKRK